jgi:hypothetical protein
MPCWNEIFAEENKARRKLFKNKEKKMNKDGKG